MATRGHLLRLRRGRGLRTLSFSVSTDGKTKSSLDFVDAFGRQFIWNSVAFLCDYPSDFFFLNWFPGYKILFMYFSEIFFFFSSSTMIRHSYSNTLSLSLSLWMKGDCQSFSTSTVLRDTPSVPFREKKITPNRLSLMRTLAVSINPLARKMIL